MSQAEEQLEQKPADKDALAIAHSLRLTAITEERLKYLCSLPNCIVVRHSADQSEREHLHVFLAHEKPVTRKTIIARWKRDIPCMASILNSGGQGVYTLKPSVGDWAAYWRYTMSGYKIGKTKTSNGRNVYDDYAKVGATCLYFNISGVQQPDPYPVREIAEKIIVENNELNNNIIKRKIPTTQEKQHKFYLYCETYYKEFKDEEITYTKIFKLLHSYARGGFNERSTTMYAEYAMYNLLDARGDAVRMEETQNRWVSRALARMEKY